MVSNPTSIKNNKRSGLHQLRDHVEILEKSCGIPKDSLHCYLFWPFLTMWTRDPAGQRIQRWKEEGDKHVFTDTISDQTVFNDWFYANILDGKPIEKVHFDALFKRYFLKLSLCQVFICHYNTNKQSFFSEFRIGFETTENYQWRSSYCLVFFYYYKYVKSYKAGILTIL